MAKVKGNAGIRPEIDVEAQRFTINVTADGTKDGEVLHARTYNLEALPQSIRDRLLVQGACTIIQQRVSSLKGALARAEGMPAVWDRWLEGEFEAERIGGPREIPAIIEVLAAVSGAKVGAVQKSWSKLDDVEKSALKKKYAKRIAKVEEERAASDGVDLTSFI